MRGAREPASQPEAGLSSGFRTRPPKATTVATWRVTIDPSKNEAVTRCSQCFRIAARQRIGVLMPADPATKSRKKSTRDPLDCMFVSDSLRNDDRKNTLLAAVAMRSLSCDFETF